MIERDRGKRRNLQIVGRQHHKYSFFLGGAMDSLKWVISRSQKYKITYMKIVAV